MNKAAVVAVAVFVVQKVKQVVMVLLNPQYLLPLQA
jgi:hypothetical protein